MELSKRKFIRLKEYDYRSNGAYFITICTHNHKCLFGDIVGAALCGSPNQPDVMIARWILELEHKFQDTKIDSYVIMPNHIHFILMIESETGTHTGVPLHAMVDWFKTMTTNAYIRGVKEKIYPPFVQRFWQRGYYEHVIRNEQSYQEIQEYIATNPLKWELDQYYKK